ncbi:DmX-like protein 1 [Dichanthelium oligosanthes]|uniref:DmX-like protein 1 n=1 Tax=Dichanthelium oligosanthes TaxID=888268 RepID=A0A1E5V3X7_9POAL|nr:DmX-like protein 1 [Dichanthelium oligosanthes]
MGERNTLPPLPLALGPPHLIPPAPTREPRAIAFLPDLGGLPWVAYAAGSFLVVSHLPSPSRDDTSDGAGDDGCYPFFRQVIDLRAPVSTVAWCGRESGEVAAAAGNSVSIFHPASGASSPGSFGWLLRWSITETFAITNVAWTGSGDGIVAVGSGVSIWARAHSSWQLAWRSMPKVPQSLVSTTQFMQGPVATVEAVALAESSVPVLVFLNDAKRGLEQAELVHPQPVCMIQWRPWLLCVSDRSEVRRKVLMTCCLDGTVRLWSEDELVKSKKQRGLQISFSIIAVIEVNNTLNGVLGVDITVRWSMESGSVVLRDEGGKFELFSGDSRESQVGKCEWLVSVGPGSCVNFWAVHCLDDVFPPRYPRITLWKQSKLQGWGESYVKSVPPKSLEQSIFVEAVISRRLCSDPPTTCSLLHLLHDDSFVWSALSNSLLPDSGTHVSSESANSISCCLTKSVKQYGHKGSIKQVSVHPYSCEIELAVSMDSNSMLFFWSLSTFSTLIPTLHAPTYPLWKLLCKFDLRNISEDVQYSCLCWAPSVIHDSRFLVLGGESGANCFIVRIQKEALSCQKIFTIPFLGERNGEGPPDSIHTIPLASKCGGCFVNNSFLVVCIWRKSFQAFSWKVVLHSESQYDNGRCLCGFAESSLSTTSQGRHVTCFNSGTFSAVVYEGSSVFPSSLEGEYPTCISVVSLNNTVLPIQHDPYRTVPGYHIATGCSNGTVKLWKMSCADNSLQTEKGGHIWELVGMYGAHQGPVSMVLLSSCGRVVTVCRNLMKDSTSIHIWEEVKLIRDGSFLLEDALILQGQVVGLDGLSLGDGRFLLAVYLPNELRIYSHKHPSFQNVLRNENSKEEHLWRCIALSHSHHDIAGFLWGPKATITLVHGNHLSVFSSWLVTGADEYTTHICASPIGVHEMLPRAYNFNETAFGKFKLPENYNSGTNGSNGVLRRDQDDSHCSHSLWNLLDITDKLSGPVPLYHPRALVQYLYSGEWKRANAALQHLVQSMKASEASKVVSKCSSCHKSCHSIPELPLSEYFVATMSNNISNKGFLWDEDRSNTTFNLLSPSNSFLYVDGNLGINTTTSASKNSEIVELLDKNFSIYGISDTERTQILAIYDLIGEITNQSRSSPYKSLDQAGRRFWVAVQFRQLHALRRSGYSSSSEGFHVDSASISWAFQSDCQDDLLNSVLSLEPTWPEMQKLAIGLWYTNVSQLRTRMEKLARSQYLKSKDPKDCALLYIALNRIKVLVGLFKISRDEKDKRLYEFLSRNFQEERHKAAALKNAYVLMGRHQWELAIAFFLLGDDFSSAVNVCAKNLQDEQLAIVICRLVEGSGGPLERNLISNVLLPDAVEKGDNWLSSLLEWMLGNYCQSINRLFGCHPKLLIDESKILSDPNVFSDPEVGQYCAILSTKNGFRKCVGEAVSAKLSKLSFVMAACALNKCGLPLEALECLSTNSGIDGKESINSPAGGDHKIFDGVLNPYSASKNWLSSSVISDIESNLKVTMASKYLSRLLRNHFLCPQCNASLSEDKVPNEYNSHQIEELTRDVTAVISIFDRRFSLKVADIAEKILILCCHDGLLFLAYVLLWGCRSPDVAIDGHGLECRSLRPINYLLLVSFKESCKFLSRHIVYSSMCFILNMELTNTTACAPKENHKYIIAGLSNYLNASRLLLSYDNGANNILGNRSAMLMAMDLLEYIIEFSFSWLYCDTKALLIMISPVLAASVNGESFQVLLDQLMHAMRDRSRDISWNTEGGVPSGSVHKIHLEKSENSNLVIDEKWHLIGASLWIRLTYVMQHYLREFVEKERLEHETGDSDSEFKGHFSSVAAKFAMDSIHFVSSSLVKLHASFLRKSLPINSHSSLLFWLERKSSQQWSGSNNYDQLSRILQLANIENMEAFNILWEVSVNSVDICDAFVNEGVNCFSLSSINVTRSWKDIRGATVECKNNSTQRSGEEHKHGLSSKNNDQGQGFADEASSSGEVFPETKRKELVQKDFQSPRELLRRSGELLEAICLNSINEKQAAIATNRKGLVFFNWSEKKHYKKFVEYVWSGSDWPSDGWAGCESTPTPTYISSGVSLGRKKGSQLGSGGAGLGSLAKPGRDLTGGGAFGIPGYAGIGASGFGWGEPEEFEDFIDPPATLENIHSRALSRHPSLPLFLVGSSNTHVYLWEFGKDSAMATYGVLPAANIPPPYALASISAVQFDYYGQRFATAALDGTVCTWQVEVGGRSNVHPTESSVCYDSHASDVSYVSASGSVVASAGCNSNGANVVIWDMLSPPATCQTSIMCHEGGARSLSVFDGDRGCGSISPLVVTGGKNGDVALHDFRFLSTGKSQHNRISTEHGVKASSTHDNKSGTSGCTTNGMVWHIPKAHLGSVTKVTTIPNTSLFLTGSKDGDVKLWDAKNSQLVFHWPKLHERHTFFQPTSRGFGGVVRAAVTDFQVLSHGFISCGGDGSVKLVQLKDDLAQVHQQ